MGGKETATLYSAVMTLEVWRELQRNGITVLPITKGRNAEEILGILKDLQITEIGENRIEECLRKLPSLPSPLTVHFVGHLHSKKIRSIAQACAVIQSLDSLRYLLHLEKACAEMDLQRSIFLEVNTSGEPQKGGCRLSDVQGLVGACRHQCPHLRFRGLMTIGHRDRSVVRAEFRLLRELRDELQKTLPASRLELSMGMTEDYDIAIEEGATMIRIGRGLFEAR